MRRGVLVLAAGIGALALAQTAVAQTAPPTLVGETLSATTLDVVEVSPAACNPGGGGTFTFTARGIASGPYPGTFEATGTYVIGPHPPFAITADVQYHETFTIWSGDTTITGTKELTAADAAPFGAMGQCQRFFTTFGQRGRVVFASGVKRYEATISDASGSTQVSGHGVTNAFDERYDEPGGPNPDQSSFFESFLSSTPASAPTTVVLTPPSAVNTVGTAHTVTATASAEGEPTPGYTIFFSVEGSTTATGSCTTDANGACSFTYTGPLFPGADVITGCADSNGNGAVDSTEPCGEATKIWVFPVTTPGQVTGGGWILMPGSEQVSFGFNAQGDGSDLMGNCNVVDHATNTHLKCLTVDALVIAGSHATFYGQGEVDGAATEYRIDVDDLGEPPLADTFRIQTDSGYTAAGVLAGGNIQVHE